MNIYEAQNILVLKIGKTIFNIIHELNKRGHKALLVGGCVRDAILKLEPKDIDIEVYNISYADLSDFLSQYGKVDLVGKAFGTIKFTPKSSSDVLFDMTTGVVHGTYDFSIPRKESKIGVGHKSFEVSFDKDMSIMEASARRDFTFNALAYDPIENKIHDYFGGLDDIENKIIRHTSEQFKEDSLRILRCMQFSARFGFKVHPDTIQIIREILTTGDYETLPKERIFEEWKKFAEKGVRHDMIFDFMRDTNLIDYYPELKALKDCQQDSVFHPEGDVEIHTSLCLKAMDDIIDRENDIADKMRSNGDMNAKRIEGDEKLILVMAILLHDIAKPPTSKNEMKNGRMTITSNGHEEMGGIMAKDILDKMGFHKDLIDPICNLISNHLAGITVSTLKAVKRLSRRLAPATIQQLLYVMEADTNGRGNMIYKRAPGSLEIADLAAQANVQNKPYEYILMGRHLIDAGLSPGPKFGEILKKANEAQEDGLFNDLGSAKIWLQNYLKPISSLKGTVFENGLIGNSEIDSQIESLRNEWDRETKTNKS